MKLRYHIVHMTLDIEYHTKLQLLRMMDKFNEDTIKRTENKDSVRLMQNRILAA